MDYHQALADLERRLTAARISVARVCRRADIHAVTVVRWKAGTPPREETWAKFAAAAEALLAEAAKAEAA